MDRCDTAERAGRERHLGRDTISSHFLLNTDREKECIHSLEVLTPQMFSSLHEMVRNSLQMAFDGNTTEKSGRFMPLVKICLYWDRKTVSGFPGGDKVCE